MMSEDQHRADGCARRALSSMREEGKGDPQEAELVDYACRLPSETHGEQMSKWRSWMRLLRGEAKLKRMRAFPDYEPAWERDKGSALSSHPDPHRWKEKPWFLRKRSLLPSGDSERTEG